MFTCVYIYTNIFAHVRAYVCARMCVYADDWYWLHISISTHGSMLEWYYIYTYLTRIYYTNIFYVIPHTHTHTHTNKHAHDYTRTHVVANKLHLLRANIVRVMHYR